MTESVLQKIQMNKITKLIVVYDADGTIFGEISYILGHALGLRECSACDITHSLSQIGQGTGGEKPAWSELKKKLSVPVVQLHRNDLIKLDPMIWGELINQVPAVFAERADQSVQVLIDKSSLEACEGSVDSLQVLIQRALDTHMPAVKCAMRKRTRNKNKNASTTKEMTASASEVSAATEVVYPFWFKVLLFVGVCCVVHLLRMTSI